MRRHRPAGRWLERTSREVFARCLTGKDREQYVGDADELIEAVRHAFARVCPAKAS